MLKQNVFMVLLLLCTFSSSLFANTEPSTTAFIDKYSPIAVAEMHKSGIPASITLGQAIIESGWGRSELARNSNNFFGIKCKSTWVGDGFMYKDDDYENGKLVDSCFRVYENVSASFQDHTDFLMNRHYYKGCFEYASDDYMNWAIGLQKSGYATAKDYAIKLVDIIEKYDLHRFDTKYIRQSMLSSATVETVNRETTMPYLVCMPISRADIEGADWMLTQEEVVLVETENRILALEIEAIAAAEMPLLEAPTLEIPTMDAPDFVLELEEALTPPLAHVLPENYVPGYKGNQLNTRSVEPVMAKIFPSTEEKSSYFRQEEKENAVKKQHPYNRTINTYKKHVRPIRHYPKASNNKRR